MAEMEVDITDVIKTTVDELMKVLATDNVIGETMEIEDKTVIPLTKIGLMFGTMTGMGSRSDRKGEGAGAGGGAGIEPVSVIVVFKDVKGPEGAQIVPVSALGPIAKMIGDLGYAAKGMMKKGMMHKGIKKKEK